jgi:hypothetical protein
MGLHTILRCHRFHACTSGRSSRAYGFFAARAMQKLAPPAGRKIAALSCVPHEKKNPRQEKNSMQISTTEVTPAT